jgi:phosphonate metabolism protein (transferase hexapeptide repeat family)
MKDEPPLPADNPAGDDFPPLNPQPLQRPRKAEPAVHPSASLRNAKLGRFTEVKERVSFKDSVLGDYSYIERDTEVIYSRIGKFCSIAAHVRINALQHPVERVTTHKISYRGSEYFTHVKLDGDFREKRILNAVEIGHDVWIGHGAIILPGLQVGDGAVIGAGSVVTKPIPPYAIYAGNPARKLRDRFAPALAERLRALRWWDWDDARLGPAVEDLRTLDIEAFLERHETPAGR